MLADCMQARMGSRNTAVYFRGLLGFPFNKVNSSLGVIQDPNVLDYIDSTSMTKGYTLRTGWKPGREATSLS